MLKQDRRLKQLLRQNCITPSDEEWRKFDRSLANRMLAAAQPSLLEKIEMFFSRGVKFYGACACVALLCVVFLKAVRNKEYNDSQKFCQEYVEFATDKILANAGATNFNTSDMGYSFDGVEYINDTISSENYLALLADR